MELYILLFEKKKMYQDFNRGFNYRIKFKFSIPFLFLLIFFHPLLGKTLLVENLSLKHPCHTTE